MKMRLERKRHQDFHLQELAQSLKSGAPPPPAKPPSRAKSNVSPRARMFLKSAPSAPTARASSSTPSPSKAPFMVPSSGSGKRRPNTTGRAITTSPRYYSPESKALKEGEEVRSDGERQGAKRRCCMNNSTFVSREAAS